MSDDRIMTSARFVVQDGHLIEAALIPSDIKIGWHNSAVMSEGGVPDKKLRDVMPLIFALPFNLNVIRLAYGIPNKKFEVFVEEKEQEHECPGCESEQNE